ncbi:MAG: glycosyltransferase family 4 protein, partial [Candidatus Altimarinota bacterium]
FQAPNSTPIQTNFPNKFFNLALSFSSLFKIDQLIEKKLQRKIKFDAFFMPDLRPFQISKNLPSITTIHDIAFLHFPRFYSFKSRLWYALIRAKNLIRKNTHIISVSNFTKQDLIKTLHLLENKITTIYPGLPALTTANNYSEIKKLYQLPEKYFLTLSTLEPRKNLQRIIQAFQKFSQNHPDYQLIIAGNSNPEIFQSENFSKTPQIHFIGFVPEEHKYQLIKNSQLLIYASLFEGFGFPILEAQACQTRVLTSNLSSMPEVAGTSAILVNPNSTDSIADGMEKLLKIPSQNSENIQKFSWEKSAQELIKLFQKLAN